jgi:hypothetical protein
MSRRLSDREYAALMAAQSGLLFQHRHTGRYLVKVRGSAKGRSPNHAARMLRVAGLIAPPRGLLVGPDARLIPIVPTEMGLIALEREGIGREGAAA